MNELSLLSAAAPTQAPTGANAAEEWKYRPRNLAEAGHRVRGRLSRADAAADVRQPEGGGAVRGWLRRGRLAVAAGSGIRQGDRRKRRCRHRRRGRPPTDPGAGSAGTPAVGLPDA